MPAEITSTPREAENVKTVNDRTAASRLMVQRAEICRALWGGTESMRKAGTKYLPQEPKEEADAYSNRISRSVLYNAYRRTVLSLRGRPFRDGVQLHEDVPDAVREWAQNIDLSGRSLSVFMRDVLTDSMNAGLCHVLVDYPPYRTKQNGAIVKETLQDEQEAKKRPWLVQIPMENVLGWRSERRGGERRLTMIRIRERVTIPDGKWGEQIISRVRVIYAASDTMPFGRVEIWEGGGKNKDNWNEAIKVHFGLTSFKDIPLYTVYTNQTGFMMAEPPLLDLAHNNVLHWQASSDLSHIVHVTNFPILYLAGDLRGQGDDDEDPIMDAEGDTSMGPNMLIQGKVGTTLSFVEHTGAAIASGERRIQAIEEHMSVLGMDMLVPRVGGPETATGRAIDFTEEISDLEAITKGLQSVVSDVIRRMVEVSNVTDPVPMDEEVVEMGSNMGLSVKDATDIEALKFARQNRDISRIQYIRELKRRRVLESDYDPDDDEDELENESPLTGDSTSEFDLVPGGEAQGRGGVQ